ncbi:type III pantothenate kinase [Mycoplasma sp. VS403A]|uniref:type III pantothenate kinase n=1 Tax=Mycoplasma sp. VS403A TaxID=3401668 RepID=UPI003AAC3941
MQKNEINYLVFDIGNTKIKFYYISSAMQTLFSLNWLCESDESIELANILALCMPNYNDQVIIASTNQNLSFQERLYSELKTIGFRKMAILNNSIDTNLLLDKNIQKDQLGIDILACLQYCANNGIWNAYVFMFGTALVALEITNGVLQGASIAPGAYTSYIHLQEKVSQLLTPYASSAQLGQNTQDALNSGLYNLLNGFILSHCQEKKGHEVLVTGGDGVYLKEHYNYKPDLIAQGYIYLFLKTK